MLTLTLLFFAALAIGATSLAWLGHVAVVCKALPIFAFASVASLLISALLLFLGMSIFTPGDPALYFPTLVVAQAPSALTIAAAMTLVRNHWSRTGKVCLALSLSLGFSLFGVIFLLWATCAVQSNCL
ncbi:MAG: hypothetical protein BWZ07_00044 [Alphaproteobacteria bacterium ADurb.BinA280]|jgi:hypothetical protein|nr:MAG: hypothetical protein BWZ07_00044 [Alphaproteobacteria bacterium ADurb.BinA280]